MTTALLLCSAIAANAELVAGNEALQALRYERALEHFTNALTTAESTTDRSQAYVSIGLCRFELGDEARARQAFRDALALDRAARLSPLASPKIEAAFAEERARLAITDVAAHELPPPSDAVQPPHIDTSQSGANVMRWPTLAAGGAALAMLTSAVVIGVSAKSTHNDAQNASFASDAQALDSRAHSRARTANIFYAGGAVLGAFALVYTIAF